MSRPKRNSLNITDKIKRALRDRKNRQINQLWMNDAYIINQLSQLIQDGGDPTISTDVKEMEHQKGRFLRMKDIRDEIEKKDLTGDILEFGTWRGLGLILLSILFSEGRHHRTAIGIDSFEGLPIASTVWKKGAFSDTSIDVADNNIKKYSRRFEKRVTVRLIKGWFDDPGVTQSLRNMSPDPVLVHFDADLGLSTSQALNIVEPYLLDRKKPIYFLFDDWGVHPDEVPDAFFSWLERFRAKGRVSITKLSSTRFTRYYRLNFVD